MTATSAHHFFAMEPEEKNPDSKYGKTFTVFRVPPSESGRYGPLMETMTNTWGVGLRHFDEE